MKKAESFNRILSQTDRAREREIERERDNETDAWLVRMSQLD